MIFTTKVAFIGFEKGLPHLTETIQTIGSELDGVPACNLKVTYDTKSGQHSVLGTASSAYTCESTTVNGETTLRVSFND